MSPSLNAGASEASNGVTNGTSNGTSTGRRELSVGLYVPTVAFFTADDKIDVEATATHAVRLARAGVAGIVTHGSNGEAVHLDHAERQLTNQTTRSALDAAGFSHLPLIVGCGAASLRETVQLCKEAAASGGDYAIVLPAGYYSGLLTPELILQFFRDTADASPIPIVIYNFPPVCSGIDLSSTAITELSKHPNIVGVKLTCGNTGKLARIVAATSSRSTPFRVFGGSVDFTLQTLSVAGHGIIGGLANIAPRACARLIQLWQDGKYEEARALQAIIAEADWVAIQGGFVSVKAGLQEYYGYGGLPRKPCVLLEGEKYTQQVAGFAELVDAEKKLEKTA